jgi:hypothetical protein
MKSWTRILALEKERNRESPGAFAMKTQVCRVPLFALFLLASLVPAAFTQDNPPPQAYSGQNNSKPSTGQITVQGCVSRSAGDYILMKLDPGMTYQLQSTGKIKLSHYLGQQVEVTAKESPSLRTSSSTPARTGSPSVALTITSIKTIAKECSAR